MSRLLPGYIPPSEVPNGWEKLQLRDVALIVPGGTLGVTKGDYIASGVPAFSAAGQDGYVDIAEFHSPGVVLSSIGAHCGRCFRAEDAWTTLANTQAILPNLERVDHRFLFARLNDKTYWEKLGSAQPFIKPSSVKESWIALPPIEEQRRIAEVLDSIDKTIQAEEEKIGKLSKIRVGLATDLLSGRLARYSWQITRLGEIADVRARIGWRGLSSDEYTQSGPYLIAGKHIAQGRIDWQLCDRISRWRYEESQEIALHTGDVVISKDGTIGRVAYIDVLPGPATLNGTMMLVRPSEKVLNYRFLAHSLEGDAFQKLIAERTSGSSVPHLFQRDLDKLRILLPPLAEQKRIAEVLDSVDESIYAAKRERDKLVQLRAGLAADLLSGRVRTVAA